MCPTSFMVKHKHIRLTVGTDNVQASESIKILGVTLDHSMNIKKQ